MKNKQVTSGFTIVELLVVISIIALLVGILVPAVQKARDSAKVTQSKSNIHQVTIALQTYASDHNDRNFSTAPDDLSSGTRLGTPVTDAITDLTVAEAFPLGIRLGEMGGNGYLFFISTDPWFGGEIGGVVPYAFASGNTGTTSDRMGMGTWRYPNALQVAEYMEGKPLHAAYFAPKDSVPLKAIEDCLDTTGSYCGTTEMKEVFEGAGGQLDALVTSNMLAVPSSYTISPAMMYHPTVYNPAPFNGGGDTATDPMDMPRGFKPPSLSQVKYPSNKTWLMEHSWLNNLSVNECSRMLGATWFMSGEGSYDGCAPSIYNAHPDSEPVTVFADGSVMTYSINNFIIDSGLSKPSLDPWARQGGLEHHALPFDNQYGYYSDFSELVHGDSGQHYNIWTGHTHTKYGASGRDKLSR